jgi:hypothetical protein
MRRFYKYTLCIIENFRLTNPHLHHGLLGEPSETLGGLESSKVVYQGRPFTFSCFFNSLQSNPFCMFEMVVVGVSEEFSPHKVTDSDEWGISAYHGSRTTKRSA